MINLRTLQSIDLSPRHRITAQIALMTLGFTASFVWDQDYNLQAGMICLAAMTMALVMAVSDARVKFLALPTGLRLILTMMVGLMLWTWIRAFTSDVPATSMMAAGFYATPLLVAFWALLQTDTSILVRVTKAIFIVLAAIAVSGIGIAAYGDITGHYLHNTYRVDWPMQDANHYAMLMNAGLIGGLALMTQTKYRRIGAFLSELFFIGTLLAGSRAGMIALAMGMVILLWPYRIYGRASRPLIFKIIACAIITVLAVACLRPHGITAFTGMADLATNIDQSSGNRPMVWYNTLKLASERPLFGYGTATFIHVYPATMSARNYDAGFAAHNDWLQTGLEMGLIGALLYAGLGLTIVYRAWTTRGQANDYHLAVRHGALAVMTTLAIHAQIEFMLMVVPVLIIFGLAIGLFLHHEIAKAQDTTQLPIWSKWRSQAIAVVVAFLSAVSLSETYAQICVERSNQALYSHDSLAFVRALEQSSFYSFDLHAYPYLKTAQYRLSLYQSGATTSIADVQNALNATLMRNPYSSLVYEIQAQLDQYQGKSPADAWRKGLSLEPRNADLRIALLRYYENHGEQANLMALVKDSRGWHAMKGSFVELKQLLKRYP